MVLLKELVFTLVLRFYLVSRFLIASFCGTMPAPIRTSQIFGIGIWVSCSVEEVASIPGSLKKEIIVARACSHD